MQKNLKVLLVIPILVFSFAFLSRTAYGSWFDTLNIIRQTPPPPPNPPTPPTKPEPSPPPTPPCGDPGCPTPTPTPSPSPSSSPTPTPPENGGNGGTGGAPFQFGGPPPPGQAGQVLGATTLGATGAAEENMFYALFALGSLLSGVGVRKFASSKVR